MGASGVWIGGRRLRCWTTILLHLLLCSLAALICRVFFSSSSFSLTNTIIIFCTICTISTITTTIVMNQSLQWDWHTSSTGCSHTAMNLSLRAKHHDTPKCVCVGLSLFTSFTNILPTLILLLLFLLPSPRVIFIYFSVIAASCQASLSTTIIAVPKDVQLELELVKSLFGACLTEQNQLSLISSTIRLLSSW